MVLRRNVCGIFYRSAQRDCGVSSLHVRCPCCQRQVMESNSRVVGSYASGRSKAVFVGVTVTFILATLFVVARLVSRFGVLKRRGWDDYFIILAWVSRPAQGLPGIGWVRSALRLMHGNRSLLLAFPSPSTLAHRRAWGGTTLTSQSHGFTLCWRPSTSSPSSTTSL
jgi:hypothetical protein